LLVRLYCLHQSGEVSGIVVCTIVSRMLQQKGAEVLIAGLLPRKAQLSLFNLGLAACGSALRI